MYSCEKLARGASGGIIKRGRISKIEIVTQSDKRGNANMFSVVTEKELERPVGKLYSSSMKTEEVHK